jgi:hypothetical protein
MDGMVPRALVLSLVVACGGAPPPRPFVPPVPREPVVVAIVIDQLAAWVASERLETLPRAGGFARLRREGIWYKRARFAHAVSDTGPGHAALHTGAPPRESGIWANERVADDGTKRSLFADPLTQVVTPAGLGGEGSSARPLRRQTVADRLAAARPNAVVASVSLKDRTAILGAGRRPTLALWFDRDLDTFVSSTAYTLRLPGWVAAIAGKAALAERRKRPWAPLDPAWVAARARVPDDGPGEGDVGGFGTTFPHRFTAAKDPARAFRSSPLADEVVLDLGIAAIERLPVAGAPFYLVLGLSANDYIGHTFGPESREAWDCLLRLDAGLARLFAALDHRFGADGWSAILGGDHGVSRMTGRRIIHRELHERLEGVAEKTLGPGPWLSGVLDPYVELGPKARALPSAELDALVEALSAALLAEPGIAFVRDARKPAAACPPESDDSPEALLCRALPPTPQPLLMIALGDGAFWDPDLVIGKGANHGTMRLEDREVPILVRAPGRLEGGTIVEAPVSYTRFTSTVADLLGIAR